jgi:acyl-CoA dehydrogenase
MTLSFALRPDIQSAREIAGQVRKFVDTEIAPVEGRLLAGGPDSVDLLAHLQGLARERGLWGVGYPVELGGRGLPLSEYLLIGEQEGRSQFGPAVFGTETVVDAHMLSRHGTPTVQERFVHPMARGEASPSYGMTEPGRTGSEAGGLVAQASLAEGMWTVRGRKWFVSNAVRATFITVVARTSGLGRPANKAFSLIVVPTDADGFRMVRGLPVLGQFTGQGEIELCDVQVPEDYLVGKAGAGMAVVRERLGLARVLRSMHWLGQAQHAYDLMCQRLRDRKLAAGRLGDKQLMQQHVFESYLEISAARALVRRAASRLDAGQSHGPDLSVAKVAASRAISAVLDRAVQVFGAEGLTDDTPLASMFRAARAARIVDGADEVHITMGGYQLLKSTSGTDSMDFTDLQDPLGFPNFLE